MPQAENLRTRFESWLSEGADDAILRWLYGGLVAAAVTVLALDYAQLYRAEAEQAAAPAGPAMPPMETAPAAEPLPATRRGGDRRAAPLRKPDTRLSAKMTFDLQSGGRLVAAGTIVPGTAEAFAAEIEKRGDYVRTVVLHSPGGSVQDALRMGRLIREKKFGTEVETAGYCASSCPLVFAAGTERRAGEKAAIGVHQVFTVTEAGISSGSGDHAQRVSAQCQRYLRDMGVDLEVWMRAMETPKEQLFYFSAGELLALRLATQAGNRSNAQRTGS